MAFMVRFTLCCCLVCSYVLGSRSPPISEENMCKAGWPSDAVATCKELDDVLTKTCRQPDAEIQVHHLVVHRNSKVDPARIMCYDACYPLMNQECVFSSRHEKHRCSRAFDYKVTEFTDGVFGDPTGWLGTSVSPVMPVQWGEEKYVALILQGTHDSNTGFHWDSSRCAMIECMRQKGVAVKVVPVTNKPEAIAAIKSAGDESLKYLILAGHGDALSISFGKRDMSTVQGRDGSQNTRLTIIGEQGIRDFVEAVKPKLAEHAIVFLDSCATAGPIEEVYKKRYRLTELPDRNIFEAFAGALSPPKTAKKFNRAKVLAAQCPFASEHIKLDRRLCVPKSITVEKANVLIARNYTANTKLVGESLSDALSNWPALPDVETNPSRHEETPSHASPQAEVATVPSFEDEN